jgi:S1-C subfamily serine protease
VLRRSAVLSSAPCLVAASALLALVRAPVGGAVQDEDPAPLELGHEFEGTLDVGSATSQCFVLDLPADVVALDLQLDCPLADLDLYANPREHVAENGASRWRAFGDEGDEELAIHRLGDEELGPGKVFVCVVYDYEDPPVVGGHTLARAPFRLSARAHRAREDAVLAVGVPRRDALDPESGGFRCFGIDVPEGAAALRIDLFDVAGDLDLFARRGTGVLLRRSGTAEALNPWGAETLLITRTTQPALKAGRWTVQIENIVDPRERASFAILASLAETPPAEVCGLPQLGPPSGATGLARALPSVFELYCGPYSGSGTCVSADGWVLTNAHVVATGQGSQVVLCAPIERGQPARESFRGLVELFDADRDLALVRVVSGFRGEPLPVGYSFPAVPLGDPERLEMGDGLWLAGYPTAGGQRSRVTISLSRGIVSGFERGEHGLLVKTDAEIQGGSSGGAALDAQGQLIGVPTSLVESGAGQFGFVQPLTALPDAWRARLGLAR